MRASPKTLLCGAALALVTACSSGNSSSYSVLDQPDSGWSLVFRDEFNGFGKPDPEKWISQEYNRRIDTKGPDGWWLKENVRLDGWGHLEIRVNEIENRKLEQLHQLLSTFNTQATLIVGFALASLRHGNLQPCRNCLDP